MRDLILGHDERKAAERTISGVRQAIRRILAGITPTECANYFAARYDHT